MFILETPWRAMQATLLHRQISRDSVTSDWGAPEQGEEPAIRSICMGLRSGVPLNQVKRFLVLVGHLPNILVRLLNLFLGSGIDRAE
ncbi:unnamed protein product [Heligmosomoides polygyrus]|uniref:Phosphoglycerate mutase n=1 Tax=Heligmosomoides polygyrus TaxID=6339 RepID=A0A183FDK2_HELPZ|nr:unnamed protein product [Heligmosomoides polygyrus]